MASRGCAQDADGSLLDESQISWYNDVDDTEPIPSSSAATATSSTRTTPQLSASTLDNFLINVPPTRVIAGSRRSARVPRPSARATDPENTMAPAHLRRKRSPSIEAPSRHRVRKIVLSSEDEGKATKSDDAEKEDSDVDHLDKASEDDGTEGNDDNDDADPEAAYQHTKSLGDADRKVCMQYPYFICASH
jgi:hypothetical protein